MTITANSLFAGGGLMDLGLREGGITIQQSFELDEVCCQVMEANRHATGADSQHEVVRCDITKKLVADEKPCDVRVLTYPCQRYSTIGDVHGVRTGDEMYLHSLRHMALAPTEAFVAENVPGMRKFPVVMEVMTRLPGYYITVFCPVSTHTWLPQRRERLIIIGTRRAFQWRPPECGQRVRLRDILEADANPHYPDYINRRMNGKYRDLPIISDPERDDIAPTCVAHYSKDLSTRLVRDARFPNGVRPYTVREYARLQGLPDSFQFPCSDNEAYKMIGNGVPIPMGRWIGSELTRYFERSTTNRREGTRMENLKLSTNS